MSVLDGERVLDSGGSTGMSDSGGFAGFRCRAPFKLEAESHYAAPTSGLLALEEPGRCPSTVEPPDAQPTPSRAPRGSSA